MVDKYKFPVVKKTFPTTIRDEIPSVQAVENAHEPGKNVTNNGNNESYETKLLLDDANCDNCRYKYKYWYTNENSWCYHHQSKPDKPICSEYEFVFRRDYDT